MRNNTGKQLDSLNQTPDELLTEITGIVDEIVGVVRTGTMTQHFTGQGIKSKTPKEYASEILSKCHQSEAARIKQLELGKKLSMESDNRIEQAIGKVLGYPAYKDDQKNFPNATEADGVCVGDHVAESLVMELVDRFKDIRADQSKKIATELNGLFEYCNTGLVGGKKDRAEYNLRMIDQIIKLIAKLQKGELPEGEK